MVQRVGTDRGQWNAGWQEILVIARSPVEIGRRSRVVLRLSHRFELVSAGCRCEKRRGVSRDRWADDALAGRSAGESLHAHRVIHQGGNPRRGKGTVALHLGIKVAQQPRNTHSFVRQPAHLVCGQPPRDRNRGSVAVGEQPMLLTVNRTPLRHA